MKYLERGELPPLDPEPYDVRLVHDNGLIHVFYSKRAALKFRRKHNLWT